MSNKPVVESKTSSATWIGLFIALFGMLIVGQVVLHFWPTLTFTAALWKESFIWLCVIALLIIIFRGSCRNFFPTCKTRNLAVWDRTPVGLQQLDWFKQSSSQQL
jgi:hypothetical protein